MESNGTTNITNFSELNGVGPSTDEPWQTVSTIKAKRSFHGNEIDKSQKKSRVGLDLNVASNVTQPNLGVSVSNSFDVLTVSDQMDDNSSASPANEPKPPPIFVSEVSNVNKMIQVIESVLCREEYYYKCLTQNKVRINPKTSRAYRALVKKLTELNVNFHTFQLKQERAFRVVLKNMHYSTDVDDIVSAIEHYGHKVRNISNVKSFQTKAPLSMFFIDLEPSKNNKEIYNIEFLLNAKILFEPPRKKNDVVQCKKCQRYGHTKTYCWYPFRCVKCAQNHETSTCNKDLAIPPKCVLCDGQHPANYKGCNVYKNIKNKAFPPLRQQPHVPRATEETTSASAIPQRKFDKIQVGKSFAQATKQCSNSTEDKESNLTKIIDTFFNRFEKLIEQQAQQINTFINLLTTVVSKLK